MAAAASAEPKLRRLPPPAQIEAEATERGFVPLEGVMPPDPFVARLQWLQAPMAGVAKSAEARRMAVRAERLGDYAGALARWGELSGNAAAAEEAGYALVRLNLVRDPAAARAAFDHMPQAKRDRLPGRMLEVRLLAMEGKTDAAAALAASLLEPALRVGQEPWFAVLEDISLLAMLRGDRQLSEQALARGRQTWPGISLEMPMLRCDPEAGLLESDKAVIDFSVDSLLEISGATPVWASRAGPMAQKLAARALEGRVNARLLNPRRAGGLHRQRILLSCAPHDSILVSAPLGSEIAEVKADGSIVARAVLAGMPEPAGLAPDLWFDKLKETGAPLQMRASMLAVAVEANKAHPGLCGIAERWAGETEGMTVGARLALADALDNCESGNRAAGLLAVAADDASLPAVDRRAIAARAAALGSDMALRKRMAAIAGLAANDCLLMDSQEIRGLAIEPEDYPKSLRRTELEGGVRVAYDRTAGREVKGLRVILAQPPLLFDEATKALLGKHAPLPPERDGKAADCSGQISTVRWKLESPFE